MRPIYTSTFNINPCFLIVIGKLTVLLWPRSTSINISSVNSRGRVDGQTWPTSMTSTITWGRVAGLLIHTSTTFTNCIIKWVIVAGLKISMPTTFLSQRHFYTFFLKTFIITVTMVSEKWLVLRDRYCRLKSPHIVNTTFSASRYLGVMDGGMGFLLLLFWSMLSERHTLILCSLFLCDCSGRRMD